MNFESKTYFRVNIEDLTEDELNVIYDALRTSIDVVNMEDGLSRWEPRSSYHKIATSLADSIGNALGKKE